MPWPLVNVIDGRDILLKRCLPSTDTATTVPSGAGSCHAECRISDLDTFAERPVQADDHEVKERRKCHPEQVGQEKQTASEEVSVSMSAAIDSQRKGTS